MKVAAQELDKLLSPGGAPGCPQEKHQPCLSLSSFLPISPTKEWGQGEDKYFLHRKYHVTKKKETTLQSIHYFFFFTFLHCFSWPKACFCMCFLHQTASFFLKSIGGARSSEKSDQNKDQSYTLHEKRRPFRSNHCPVPFFHPFQTTHFSLHHFPFPKGSCCL